MVPGNAYITVGDPYNDPKANPFRQGKKGEKEPTPFRTKVNSVTYDMVFLDCYPLPLLSRCSHKMLKMETFRKLLM